MYSPRTMITCMCVFVCLLPSKSEQHDVLPIQEGILYKCSALPLTIHTEKRLSNI